ncbi:MAG: 6-carboxytetrahydropterin synthase QueD [Thermoleophilia bacterium]
MQIFRAFQIEAAHYLPNVPHDHKCKRMHGHSFRIEIHVSGEVHEQSGWLIDFAEIGQAFKPIFDQLDHFCLNDIEGLENPTSENLAYWLWRQLKPVLPELSRLVVQETPSTGCVYEGPDSL